MPRHRKGDPQGVTRENRLLLLPGRAEGDSFPLACPCAASYSDTLAALSYLDHGTARLLEGWGFALQPAENLIQETLGVLSPEQMTAHETAAAHLYEIVDLLWSRICRAFRENTPLREIEVQGWILAEFEKRGLISDHAPIVAAGPNAGDPHYGPEEPSRILSPGDTVQFDLWAKVPGPFGTYADISWVGFLGETADPAVEKLFRLIRDARNRGVQVIEDALAGGSPITGAEVDREVRKVIIDGGEGEFLCHRTGHGIDAELHGWGVNLDCVEFPDHRTLREGSCFSIEPGLYKEAYGCRTEIDAYIKDGKLIVSGGPIQRELLLLK